MKKIINLLIISITFLILNQCNEDDLTTIPTVLTTEISDTTWTSAKSGGTVTFDGGSEILVKGLCWGTSANPTLKDSSTIASTHDSIFSTLIEDLQPNNTYYVRAYAINAIGIAFGNELSFRTKSLLTPTIITSPISDTTYNSAICGGILRSDGGTPINFYGVCWSSNEHPTLEDNHTIDETNDSTYVSVLEDLEPNTNYYVRAYAVNKVGTTYGNEITFKTKDVIMDADGNIYTSVQIGNQIWMVENLRTTTYNDGEPINNLYYSTDWINAAEGGYCWVNNNVYYKNIYGAIYNKYAVLTDKLAPQGWHIPTNEDWEELINFYGGEELAGGYLKADTLWYAPNTGVESVNAFNALPAGYRSQTDGTFHVMGKHTLYWSDPIVSDTLYRTSLEYNLSTASLRTTGINNNGLSVRCIKDK